jgi:hypothetical protein
VVEVEVNLRQEEVEIDHLTKHGAGGALWELIAATSSKVHTHRR